MYKGHGSRRPAACCIYGIAIGRPSLPRSRPHPAERLRVKVAAPCGIAACSPRPEGGGSTRR
eukprot:5756384-Prymnesium_polylepis.1